MPRLVGIDIPENKRIEVSLTYIYGVGPHRAKNLLKESNINPDKRAKELSRTEIASLQKALEQLQVEGTLRSLLRENVERLKRIGSYRGSRHSAGLPARGQRTRVNARTRRGKRMTVGAMKKEEAAKQEAKK
jgi:small subunit ribosomal protein S13